MIYICILNFMKYHSIQLISYIAFSVLPIIHYTCIMLYTCPVNHYTIPEINYTNMPQSPLCRELSRLEPSLYLVMVRQICTKQKTQYDILFPCNPTSCLHPNPLTGEILRQLLFKIAFESCLVLISSPGPT